MSYFLAWFVFNVFNTLAYFLLSQHVGRFDSFWTVQRSIIKGLSPAMRCLLSLLRPPSLPRLPSLPSLPSLPCLPGLPFQICWLCLLCLLCHIQSVGER